MNPLAWSNEVELGTGVVVSYWVLLDMTVNLRTAKATVSIEGFVSEEKFLEGKERAIVKMVDIDFSSFDPNGSLAAGLVAMVQAAEGV